MKLIQKYLVYVLLIILALPLYSKAQVSFSRGADYMGSIRNIVVSPDEEYFYAGLNVFNDSSRRRTSGTYKFSLEGKELGPAFSQRSYIISPDGEKMLFKGNHRGMYGLWMYSISSNDYKFIAEVTESNAFLGHRANRNYIWSPDGRQVAYCSATGVRENRPEDIKEISRILFKTRTAYSDNRKTHIFVVDLENGNIRQLTFGNYDEHSLSWSPDGNSIAFISNRTLDPDNNHNNDIWTVDTGSGKIKQITDSPGTEFTPKFSPDGKHLAFLGGTRPINTKDSPPENNQLWIIPAKGGEPVDLTSKIDRRISNHNWTKDSNWLYFTANNKGGTHIYRVPSRGGKVETVVGGKLRARTYALCSSKDRIFYIRSDDTDPGEIWSASLDGKSQKQLTNYQDKFKNSVKLSMPETFWFESFDGTTIQGWLMKPIDFQAGSKFPLILTIHGGPHGAYGYGVSSRNQNFAEAGFGVLYINPRGSTGYGQEFADGSINDWGGGDYKDLMAGVDYAIKNNTWIDAERLGVMGGSYGGYMTNWVITQTTRFKAAVSSASLSNLISFYSNSLYHLLIETEFPGKPWENYDLLWDRSPVKHIANVATPTLFIHGEADHDVPITQAEDMFVMMKKLGVETVFVRYPGEGHGFRNQSNRRDRDRRTIEWFVRFLEPDKIVRN